jgi:hypothetical protein
MRRILLMLTLAALMAAMLVANAPTVSAQVSEFQPSPFLDVGTFEGQHGRSVGKAAPQAVTATENIFNPPTLQVVPCEVYQPTCNQTIEIGE